MLATVLSFFLLQLSMSAQCALPLVLLWLRKHWTSLKALDMAEVVEKGLVVEKVDELAAAEVVVAESALPVPGAIGSLMESDLGYWAGMAGFHMQGQYHLQEVHTGSCPGGHREAIFSF